MSTLLGDARIRLRPDSSGFEGEASRSIGGAMKKVAGVAAAAFAAAGAVTFGRDIIGLASNAEQSIGGVESVFKGYADTVLQSSQDADRALGLSANSYRELATVIGSQLKNAGVPLDQLGGSTDKLISQGADLAAMFGGTTQEAVNALSSALKGEMDPIERYGISLNDAALKAEALSLGVYSGTGNLDANARSMAVMSLVTQQGADSMGAFGRESDTAAGKQQRATAQWENLKTTLGDQLLPVFTAVMGFLSDTALPGLERFGGYLTGTVVPAVQNAATWLGDRLGPVFQRVGDFVTTTVVPALERFGGYLQENILPVVRDVAAWIGDNFAPAMERLGTFITDRVVPALQTVGGYLVDTFAPAFRAVGSYFSENLFPAVSQIIETFQRFQPQLLAVAGFLGMVAGAIGVVVTQVAGFLMPIIITVAGFLVDVLGNAISFAITALGRIVDTIGWVVGAFQTVNDKVEQVRGWVVDKFTTMKDSVVGIFTTIGDTVANVWDTILDKVKEPVRVVVRFINDSIIGNINQVTSAFGLTIPRIPLNFHTGGIVPGGYSPGRDNQLAAVGSREAIMRPEWTRAVGAGYVDAANAAARTGGISGVQEFLRRGGPAFHTGGIVERDSGGPLDWIGDRVTGAWDWARDGIQGLIARGASFALKTLVQPAVGWLTDNVNNPFVSKLASGAMEKMVGAVETWGAGKDNEAAANAATVSDAGVMAGPAGSAPAGRGFRDLFNTVKAAFPQARLNSGMRPGDPGFHGRGQAVDLGQEGRSGGNGHPYLAAMNAWIYRNFPNSRELIYTGAGDSTPDLKNGRPLNYGAATNAAHKNHVHWVYDNGGVLEPGLTQVNNKSGKPEAVFNNDQWEVFKRIADGGGSAPLIGGNLVLQAAPGASVNDQMETAVFELRRLARGGRP